MVLLAILRGVHARLNRLRFVAQGPDADRDPEGEQGCRGRASSGGFPGLAESEPGRTTVTTAAHGYSCRERVWAAAHVGLTSITLDTNHHRAHALWPADGGPQGYNPKNKGKKSYQPILTFIAETHEYVGGELRSGDRPDGKQIARHLRSVIAALPEGIRKIFARADSGFYCSEAVQAYQKAKAHFIIVARKTSRLLEQLQTADWKPSPQDRGQDEQCEFRYQPEGWGQAYRFVALRYKNKEEKKPQEREQYQLFDTPGIPTRCL